MEEKIFFEGKFGKICGILNQVENSKEIVIIVHGFSSHKNTSAKICSKLLESINISYLRIDFDNRGESDLEFSQVNVSKYIEQVNSTLKYIKDNLEFKEISLIGGSFGSIVSLAFASKNNNLKRLYLRCPGIGTFYYKYLNNKDSEHYKNAKETGKIYYKDICEFDVFLLDDMEQYYPLSNLAKKINIPTGIVQGTKDVTIPHEDVLLFAKKIKNCDIKLIEGGTHALDVEGDYTEFHNHLIDFFSK